MKKRILSLFLVAVMILSTVAIAPVTVWAADNTWNPNGGSYRISTAADMMAFAVYVAEGNNCSGKTVTLENDIDLGAENWYGVGYMLADGATRARKPFNGTFDGQGYAIHNITAKTKPADRTWDGRAALFTSLGAGAVVKNVSLDGTVQVGAHGEGLTCSKGDTCRYGTVAAWIAESGSVMLQNVHSSVNIDASAITCSECDLDEVGGLIGELDDSAVVNLTFDGCIYDGSMINNCTAGGGDRPSRWGGFLGSSGKSVSGGKKTITIKNFISGSYPIPP